LAAGSLAEVSISARVLPPHPLWVKGGRSNGLERALAERWLIERSIVACAPGARVYVTDGNAFFFNRPGPGLVESLEIMALACTPEVFADFAAAHAPVIVPMTTKT